MEIQPSYAMYAAIPISDLNQKWRHGVLLLSRGVTLYALTTSHHKAGLRHAGICPSYTTISHQAFDKDGEVGQERGSTTCLCVDQLVLSEYHLTCTREMSWSSPGSIFMSNWWYEPYLYISWFQRWGNMQISHVISGVNYWTWKC